MRSAIVGAAALALGACASQSVSIRSVPSENPAAQSAAAEESAAAFAAAVAGAADAGADRAQSSGPPLTPSDAPSMRTYDPWERLNRSVYRFNARFDDAVFLRLSNAYRRIPGPIRAGVHNFFGNLTEVDSVINYGLQWRLRLGVRSLGRFVINSTIGLGGLVDVAAKLKLPPAPTGLSTTLGKWGMHPGPYLVIPFLGPSTLRDGVGFLGDYATSYEINLGNLYRGNVSWGLVGINAVDQRANISFRYYSTGSPFEYENIRFLYVRKRLIEDEGVRARRPSRDATAPAGK
jgi:phospholipid-binding lipoprotein MlaA